MKREERNVHDLVARRALEAMPRRTPPEPILEALAALGVGSSRVARLLGTSSAFTAKVKVGGAPLPPHRAEQALQILEQALDEAAIILRQFQDEAGPDYSAARSEAESRLKSVGATAEEAAGLIPVYARRVADYLEEAFHNGIDAYEFASELYFGLEDELLERFKP